MTLNDDIRRAIALGYDPEADRAPKIVAKGLGPIAEAILTLARKHGVHIHEDAALARSLYVLELGQEIPEQFYIAIAEVLAFVYRLDKKMRRKKGL
jgi:flagellar biosynthesis protein